MVDEFSSFARLPKPVFRQEDAVDLVRQALFLQEVARPDIDFSFTAHEEFPPIACDRHQFGQAMTNVLKNAAEAIEARQREAEPDFRGRIAVEVSADERYFTVAVSDNGVGLPSQGAERILEPYVTTREKGTGLGLADRQEDRRGARRRDELCAEPREGPRVTLRFARDPLAAGGRGGRMKYTGDRLMALDILVVDDEQDIRELVAGVLTDEGYECRTAGDSTRALQLVDERRPSLVLLDVWLHGSPMDGLEVLDAIKVREPQLPVIIFSGHGNIDTAVSAVEPRGDGLHREAVRGRAAAAPRRAERPRPSGCDARMRGLREGFVQTDEFTGNSSAINQVRATLKRVANTGSRV